MWSALRHYCASLPPIMSYIILSALIVRIWGIYGYAFNQDELQFLIIAKGQTLAEVWRRGLIELHPPLAQFIRHYLLMLTSDTFCQRLFSVVAGTAAILGIYQWGCILRGRFLGVFNALCMAFFPIAVSTSMTLRNYPLFMAFLCWALCYFARYQQEEKKQDLGGFTILIFLASATHFSGFLVAAACGIYEGFLLLKNRHWNQLLLLCLSYVPLGVLGIFFYLHYMAPGTVGPVWNQLGIDADFYPRDFDGRVIRTLWNMFGIFFPIISVVKIQSDFLQQVIVVIAAFLAGLYILALYEMCRAKQTIAFLIIILWSIGILASVFNIYPFDNTRHIYYLVPFILLPFGYLLEPLFSWLLRMPPYIGLLLVIVALWIGVTGVYLTYGEEFTLKEKELTQAQQYLTEHLKPKDGIVAARMGGGYFYLLYDKDAGRTPYNAYSDVPYLKDTLILAPYDSIFNPYTPHFFHDMLQTRIVKQQIIPLQNKVWFIMYGEKNVDIWHLMECDAIQEKIGDFYSRDGVIIFSIKARDIVILLNNTNAWEKCYADYKPLLSSETFSHYYREKRQ